MKPSFDENFRFCWIHKVIFWKANENIDREEKAQLVRCLLCKHKDLCLVPSTQGAMYLVNPGTREVETGRSLEHTDQIA